MKDTTPTCRKQIHFAGDQRSLTECRKVLNRKEQFWASMQEGVRLFMGRENKKQSVVAA